MTPTSPVSATNSITEGLCECELGAPNNDFMGLGPPQALVAAARLVEAAREAANRARLAYERAAFYTHPSNFAEIARTRACAIRTHKEAIVAVQAFAHLHGPTPPTPSPLSPPGANELKCALPAERSFSRACANTRTCRS